MVVDDPKPNAPGEDDEGAPRLNGFGVDWDGLPNGEEAGWAPNAVGVLVVVEGVAPKLNENAGLVWVSPAFVVGVVPLAPAGAGILGVPKENDGLGAFD